MSTTTTNPSQVNTEKEKDERSDGYYHGRITIRLAPLAGFFSFLSTLLVSGELTLAVFAAANGAIGCLLGLFIEPDLDQEMTTSSEWRVIKAPEAVAGVILHRVRSRTLRTILNAPFRLAGVILGSVWVAIWYPYALLMPHRHVLSHLPLLGTVVRVGYLWMLAQAAVWIGDRFGVDLRLALTREETFLAAHLLWGLVVSDSGHYARDKTRWKW